jgi:hypothetical protein
MQSLTDPLDGYTPRWRPSESPLYDSLVVELGLTAGPVTTALPVLVGTVVNR